MSSEQSDQVEFDEDSLLETAAQRRQRTVVYDESNVYDTLINPFVPSPEELEIFANRAAAEYSKEDVDAV